jgi:hypothetical protein
MLTDLGNDKFVSYEYMTSNDPAKQMLVWEAARASTAAPTYFPPFYSNGIKDYLYDGGLVFNNPAVVAAQESSKIWPNHSNPDVLLSIGNGICSKPPKLRKLTPVCEAVNTVAALKNLLLKNLDCEHVWHDNFGCNGSRSAPGPARNFRMTLMIDGSVKLDDTKAFDELLAHTEKHLQKRNTKDEMDAIIHRLIATSFYLKPLRLETQANGIVWFIGKPTMSSVSVCGKWSWS